MQDNPRNIHTKFVPIGQVVSEEKILERKNIKNSKKKCPKRAITPTRLNGLKPKSDHR